MRRLGGGRCFENYFHRRVSPLTRERVLLRGRLYRHIWARHLLVLFRSVQGHFFMLNLASSAPCACLTRRHPRRHQPPYLKSQNISRHQKRVASLYLRRTLQTNTIVTVILMRPTSLYSTPLLRRLRPNELLGYQQSRKTSSSAQLRTLSARSSPSRHTCLTSFLTSCRFVETRDRLLLAIWSRQVSWTLILAHSQRILSSFALHSCCLLQPSQNDRCYV